MKFARAVTRFHKWLGLIVGLQIVLWMSGGVVMSFLPIERVRGEHRVAEVPAQTLNLSTVISAKAAADGAGFRAVREAQLATWMERPVWRLTASSGVEALVDAQTGERLDPLSEAVARAVAEADYTGPGALGAFDWLEQGPREAGGRSPLWRAVFDDRDATTLYISPSSGAVVARRSTTWRVYDFFWMLHIMDYKDRENFNNPLVLTFAGAALMFALSGITLLAHRFVFRPRPARRQSGRLGGRRSGRRE